MATLATKTCDKKTAQKKNISRKWFFVSDELDTRFKQKLLKIRRATGKQPTEQEVLNGLLVKYVQE